MKNLIYLCFLALPLFAAAQKTGVHSYKIDLTNVVDDRVKITLDASMIGLGKTLDEEYSFHFPATIPGTYATLDYGRFIYDFKAYDDSGNALKVKKKRNTYTIIGLPAEIEYWAEDTFDSKVRKNKVFEPAGTNNQEHRNFLLNAAGYFGFFEGQESLPITLEVQKSPSLYGVSAMESYRYGNSQIFNARNYHHFLDCPIMVSKPDTTSFRLGEAKVTISVFTENGRALSGDIYDAVKTSMGAIENFLDGELPVTNYAFIFYIKDYTEFEGLFNGTEIRIGQIIKVIRQLAGKGFGALEHGNSSVYFLPDFGGSSVLEGMADVCIHEFFHILTPLGLHSEEIGNFNYIEPKMSQHLWLYEGITEYFAGISQVKGNVIDKEEYVRTLLRGKLVTSDKFPNDDMSFTEMSENVLEKPYKKQYPQVYQRGAVLGALLDIRIMELTNGKKDLLDIILALRNKYGPNKSFKDSDIIAEFVSMSDPALQTFFDRYITGREDLPIKEYLRKVGIEYDRSFKGEIVIDPLKDNDVKRSRIARKGRYTIKKVGKNDEIGLQEGDLLTSYNDKLQNEFGYVSKDEVIQLEVQRSGADIILPYSIKTTAGVKSHYIRFMKTPTKEQLRLQSLWLNSTEKE